MVLPQEMNSGTKLKIKKLSLTWFGSEVYYSHMIVIGTNEYIAIQMLFLLIASYIVKTKYIYS